MIEKKGGKKWRVARRKRVEQVEPERSFDSLRSLRMAILIG